MHKTPILLLTLLCIHCFCLERAYVTNQIDGTVSVIDLSTNTVETTLTIGTNPVYSAATPDGDSVYIVNRANNTVDVIDNTTTPPTVKVGVNYPIPVGSNPLNIVINQSGTKAYVTNENDNTVSVIDTTTDTPILPALATIGTFPQFLAITPDGGRLYVGSRNTTDITVFDLSTMTPTSSSISTAPNRPNYFSIDSTSSTVFVSHPLSDTVSYFPNIASPTPFIEPGGTYSTPLFLSFTPNGANVYVPNRGSTGPGSVVLLDVASPTSASPNASSPIAVDDNPFYVVLNPAGTTAYITHNNGFNVGTTVSAINTSTQAVTAILIGGNGPNFAAVNQTGSKVVVSVSGSNLVSVIDVTGGNAVTSIPVGANPQFVVIPNIATTPTPPTEEATDTTAIEQAEAITEQNLQTVNESVSTGLQSAQEIGILSVAEGTYPDANDVFIIDNTTSFTLDLQIPPLWCP